MSQTQLPQEAIDLLEKIRKKHNIPLETLKNEVITKFTSNPFFQSDKTKNYEQQLVYCASTIKGAYDHLIPYNPFDVVITGIGPIQVTKAGVARADVHVWTREKNIDYLRSIGFTEENVEKLNTLQLFNLYRNVQLGKFSSGDFSSDHRSIFENPSPVALTPIQIYEKLKIKRCKISEVLSNLAREEGKFTKTTDVRIVRGIIIGRGSGEKVTDSGTKKPWAYYDIHDSSLDEDLIDPDGVTVRPIMRVWVNPMWMIYEKDNQIDFVGPITSFNKSVSMNGYCLIPVYTPTGQIEA